MFFTGTLSASPTLPNFQADIIGILTGSITTLGGLSTNFVSADFINTVAPGWTLYDSAAGAVSNGVTPAVLRAPWSDDPTKYKNLYIDSYSATALGFNGYETWDSGTHSGTNPTCAVSAAWQAFALTNNYYVVISASANHVFLSLKSNATTAATYMIFLSEYTRDDPWNILANGYPSWLVSGSTTSKTYTGQNGGFPRLWSPTNLADVISPLFTSSTSNLGVCFTTNGPSISYINTISSAGNSLIGQLSYCGVLSSLLGSDSNKATVKYLYDIAIRQFGVYTDFQSSPWLGGNCSAINQFVYYAPNNFGAIGDDVIVGSDTYKLLSFSSYSPGRIAIKQA